MPPRRPKKSKLTRPSWCKRTKAQQDADKVLIAELLCRGKLQSAIAKAINERAAGAYTITRQQVGHDAKEIWGEWEDATRDTIEKLRAQELQRIQFTEERAWRGLEASETEVITVSETRNEFDIHGGPEGKGDKSGSQDTTGKRRSRRLANPIWMQTIQWCSEQRCRLLGLYLQDDKGMTVNIGQNAGATITATIVPVLQLVSKNIDGSAAVSALLDFPKFVDVVKTAQVIEAQTAVVNVERAA